ncbi:transposase family protein [Streptomyces sp. NPDC053069]|uniref:transposase family protein n=1 Tax=Streptomyces sp. NPDC053069 TaxID=3365695 RepID=UPI0037CEF155
MAAFLLGDAARRPAPPRPRRRRRRARVALTDQNGKLIRISAARPGRPHDATAARHDKIVEHLKAAGFSAVADLGFLCVDKPENPDDQVTVTRYEATQTRTFTAGQKQANHVPAAGRTPAGHGFAHPKSRRFLTKLRTGPRRATQLPHALPVPTNLECIRQLTIKTKYPRHRHSGEIHRADRVT